jgi:hypothetical protein
VHPSDFDIQVSLSVSPLEGFCLYQASLQMLAKCAT